MDITYKPYIRESVFTDINIKNPSINIKGYKPKYYIESNSEDPVNPVESEIKEIKELKINKNSHSKNKVFKNKKEFQDTMIPLYESFLIKKGLNPGFAKALVTQDGLESAWGSKPSGKFNFGGIKGKGTIKNTREVINGKDIYINDSFRDFKSLSEYVNYKIDLLNSNRYKAFSGNVSEFADRVHKGGYATDPNYARVLNNMILSAKNGGILKFQTGGLNEGRKWVKNWYQSRKDKVIQNYKDHEKFKIPFFKDDLRRLTNNIDSTRAYVDPEMVTPGATGVTYPHNKTIYQIDDSPTIAVHEFTHASFPSNQIAEVSKILNSYKDPDKIYEERQIFDEYLDDPGEVYSRLMELRYNLGVDPNHHFTLDEINELKKKFLQKRLLIEKYVDKDGNHKDTGITIFDKNNNVIKVDAPVLNKEWKVKESDYSNWYDENKTYNLLDRYNSEVVQKLLNDVASNKPKKFIPYAQKGIKTDRINNSDVFLFPKFSSVFEMLDDVTTQEAYKSYNNINKFWTTENPFNKNIDQKDFIEGYRTLRNYGFSRDYTNAILANWFQESNFIPNKENSIGAKYIPQFLDENRKKRYEEYLRKNNLTDGIATASKYLVYQMEQDKKYNKESAQYNKDYWAIRNKFKELVGDDSYVIYALKKYNYANPNFKTRELKAFNDWVKTNGYGNFKYGVLSSVEKDYNTFPKGRSSNVRDYIQLGPEAVKHFHDWYENSSKKESMMDQRIRYFNILMGNVSK